MNALELLYKSKVIKYTQVIIFIILCGLRLVVPITNLIYINMLFSLLIFLILPIGLWWYIQKVTNFFASSYVRVRFQQCKWDSFYLNVLINEISTILFVAINALIIFVLTFDFSGFSFIACYGAMVLYWLCIYLIFVNIFHFVFYVSKDLRMSFFGSYIFLFLLSFTTELVSPNLFLFEGFDYGKMASLILGSIVILIVMQLLLFTLSKRKREVYDKDKN